MSKYGTVEDKVDSLGAAVINKPWTAIFLAVFIVGVFALGFYLGHGFAG